MEKLRWGLIGAGDIAKRRVAPALRDGDRCELIAIARSQAELARAFAEEFGARKWQADWRELVADPEIDAVYVATPVYLHAEQTIAAAESGKHVLCEKPMAMTVNECDKMIAACRANNVKLGIAYYRRFYPAVRRVRQIIGSGEIGDVAVAQMNAFEYFNPSPDDPRRWFIDKSRSGGGPMMDFGCHRLEVLMSLFGGVRRVASIVSNHAFKREVEDTAAALMQFENGTCAAVTVTHAAIEPQDTLDIFGSKGSIHIPVLNRGEMMIRVGSVERHETHRPADNFHLPLIENFAESVIRNVEPEVTGDAGRAVAVVTEEIYRTRGRS